MSKSGINRITLTVIASVGGCMFGITYFFLFGIKTYTFQSDFQLKFTH